MDACINQLNQQMQQHQLPAIVDSFVRLSDTQQTLQLLHLYESAQRMSVKYAYLQNIATRILTQHSLPTAMINQLNNIDQLSFFTPGLKFNHGFTQQNQQQKNVLHSLFSESDNTKLPFNYVRSLMLFESNENLLQALAQINNVGLTPVASYIASNPNQHSLPKHEFSALLALMEVELKQNKGNINTAAFLKALLTLSHSITGQLSEDKILLCGAYLRCKTAQVERYLVQNK
ncbi:MULTISPECIES: hypothetical protein [Pseudoalteromonas]|uniref:hypothetical protein n=1 Tax=Pseudoalteromonas TaxID=53246 RepID=UPI00030E2425|nr:MULTISPECIES: hypothetical protein [Pseudoalteromonas]MCF6144911.1 hypothetical protein [Pseudoalteromonas mariniglutinosa NCIMB 1770]BDF95349.1 hypothetical protein KAN5_21870 [Pseudoalteromonas sp. KAN5]